MSVISVILPVIAYFFIGVVVATFLDVVNATSEGSDLEFAALILWPFVVILLILFIFMQLPGYFSRLIKEKFNDWDKDD